jgi:hypothetical protein
MHLKDYVVNAANRLIVMHEKRVSGKFDLPAGSACRTCRNRDFWGVIPQMRYVCMRRWSLRVVPPSSARLTLRSWTDRDTMLAEALWCDPEVTRFFGGAMSRNKRVIDFMPNVNVRVVSVSSTGQSSYMKQANLQGVPVYGRGRWIPRQSRSA